MSTPTVGERPEVTDPAAASRASLLALADWLDTTAKAVTVVAAELGVPPGDVLTDVDLAAYRFAQAYLARDAHQAGRST